MRGYLTDQDRANLDGISLAAWQKKERARRAAQIEERADVIASLGWAPEGKTWDDKYPSTTGELRRYLSEARGGVL